MGRRNDNAPIGNTCPIIDEVIGIIEDPIWDEENEDELHLKNRFSEALKLMEDIRSANSTLREWGNERDKDAEYWEKEFDDAKRDNDDLKSQIKDLEEEINGLQQEINDLQELNDRYENL